MTKDILVAEFIIKLSDAISIIKKLKQKKHSSFNWGYELVEVKSLSEAINQFPSIKKKDGSLKIFHNINISNYTRINSPLCVLRVYKEVNST